jgi:hypothetical protein
MQEVHPIMNRLASWLVVSLIVTLGGCADPGPWDWGRTTSSNHPFGQIPVDLHECVAHYDPDRLPILDTGRVYPPIDQYGKSDVESCMKKKGWFKIVTVRPWFP